MPQGLSPSDIVSVGVILSPTAVVGRDFGTLLIVGNSQVIDTTERMREYATLTGVASDFGTTAPEYVAAATYFAQSPQPYRVKIGRWAQTPTGGALRGAVMPASVQAARLATLQGVTTGTLTISTDGTARALTGLNFSGAANMNGVAGVINAALGVAGSCTFNGQRFTVSSNTIGTASSVGYASSPSGVDIAALTGLSQAAGASVPVVGIAAETAIAAVQALAGATSDWYGLTFALLSQMPDSVTLQVAATIEGISPVRVFGITTQASAVLDGTSTTDLAATLAAAGYSRTIVQYSSSNPYAVCSFFGRALTVNYTGNDTVITMKFKQEPGVPPEVLTENQAAALREKNCNVFVSYQNGANIIQEGVVSNGRFWDEVHGLDWLANAVQTDLFNVLYTASTKIPQTDDGIHVLVTQMEATLSRAVENGLISPGIWNAEGFGQLKRGDPLTKGFYVYTSPIAFQSQADREARKSPVLQAAVKMAGAVHSVAALISVNR